jgi:hypothetical protein
MREKGGCHLFSFPDPFEWSFEWLAIKVVTDNLAAGRVDEFNEAAVGLFSPY